MTDKMKILWFGVVDPDGFAMAQAQAINKYTEHECRVVVLSSNGGFDSDIVFRRDPFSGLNLRPEPFWLQEFVKLLEWANLIIINIGFVSVPEDSKELPDETNLRIGDFQFGQYLKERNKKIVVFLHDNKFVRENFGRYRKLFRTRGWPVLTSQSDLFDQYSKSLKTFYVLPVIDVDHPRYKNSMFDFVQGDNIDFEKIILCLNPFNNDNVFIKEVFSKLSTPELFDALPIFGISHIDAIQRQKRSNIYIDRNEHGNFSVHAMEASLVGLFPLTSISVRTKELMSEYLSELPPWAYCLNSVDDYVEGIKLVVNRDMFDSMKRNVQYMKKIWHPSLIVPNTVERLKKAMEG